MTPLICNLDESVRRLIPAPHLRKLVRTASIQAYGYSDDKRRANLWEISDSSTQVVYCSKICRLSANGLVTNKKALIELEPRRIAANPNPNGYSDDKRRALGHQCVLSSTCADNCWLARTGDASASLKMMMMMSLMRQMCRGNCY